MSTVRKPERIRSLARALVRVADADRRWRQVAAERLGIGASDFDALLAIDAAGPLTAGRIALALGITTGAVTGLVDRLERAGWVQRVRHDADRRQVLIELAAARRDALEAHWTERDRFAREAADDLDDELLARSVQLVDRVADRMTAATTVAADAEPPAVPDDGDRAPLGAIERGRLRFALGAARVSLRAARIKDLYRADFQGRRPQIAVTADGTVNVQYRGLSWFGARDIGAELTLTTAVPWTIEIRRGVSQLTADLRDLQLAALEITGGVSASEVSLPRPRGLATVRIAGGTSQLTIKRPRGTAAQVVVRGGASNFVFDAQRLGAVGSATRLATPGWDDAPDRWSIELTGGASRLAVIEA